MEFIDTHSHLYLSDFESDVDEVVFRAVSADVKWMVLPNIDSSTSTALKNLTKKYPENLLPAMGLHPTSVKNNYKEELSQLEKEFSGDKYIAVGETGIDLYWDKSYFKEQCEAFIFQIDIAKNLHLPIIIHCRESFNEIFPIIEKHANSSLFGVFHSFPGTAEQAKSVIDLGFKIGINGVVTFKNAQLPKVVEQLSLSDIVLETDAPFLTPVPKRGQRNESAYLTYIAAKIAEIKKETIEKVVDTTSNTAQLLFNIQGFTGIKHS